MSQKRNYKQYPKEFKEEAVALVLEQGYTVLEAAKSLGIAANSSIAGRTFINNKLKVKPLPKTSVKS